MLQDNVEGYRKEIASLREKGQKMEAATQKLEQTVHALNEDLKESKEKLAMAEVCPVFSVIFVLRITLELDVSLLQDILRHVL